MFRRNIRTRIPTLGKESQPHILQKAKQKDSTSQKLRKEKLDSKRSSCEMKINPGQKVRVRQDKITLNPYMILRNILL